MITAGDLTIEITREDPVSNQDTIDAITAQLTKVKTEILGKIDQLENSGGAADFTALKALIDDLDAIVPDQPDTDKPDTDKPDAEQPGTDEPSTQPGTDQSGTDAGTTPPGVDPNTGEPL
ncbi:hypothetical protein IU494_30300 [Nocardia terpenica]|uniref:hypothetical protein n=1 Tax=Nocardia terpenica TaxID=455432 RepID=UPI001895543C|nr:hypothetical protein [Nocardia terpenica]MBF6064940.1 hypothetical protein [Nocardia terpenica]MBF6115212.1 hypothetical protein [Nocardia terpenica]MBF6122534.1 hypothetical protein [Nocardia terpenica]